MSALSTFEQVELQKKLDQSSKEIERLNALVAMQADKLNKIKFLDGYDGCRLHHSAAKLLNEAIEASLSTVAAWEEQKLLSLQRQVAMLRKLLVAVKDKSYGIECDDTAGCNWFDARNATLSNTQATAEAYDRELSAKVRSVALEDVGAMIAVGATINELSDYVLKELRAANKKEGE